MSEPTVITTSNAPAAIGPYSQAKVVNGFIFTAGQIPLVPDTGKLVDGGFTQQVTQVLTNLDAILNVAGSNLGKAVKLTVFLKDFSNYAELNDVFADFFSESEPPARSALQVTKLPMDAEVEIECIAVL
ncbi:MAG: hypothetical protein HOD97_05905 [Candidatus Marinimicrobia bacterium]|jgi:2-iminobutanoate/2-iminopropanoate deaminase|nr:hypothetical protein [Candidatus Neomarinimicrobiota bacterium]MBT3617476.1 hypothetical protein [Candidatus Neomarinimicrobiota bacterium]MBT3829416.1 hypothetical protein [Candidatus Neomarinimicrobiota bacterium]MBT3997002.1 hypothetical protein [Candidatus Neomarinimicrobiota bacterium]MBT4281128.1 hypothetical protein [Candidatus Neomarinimicrobiota bacterium]